MHRPILALGNAAVALALIGTLVSPARPAAADLGVTIDSVVKMNTGGGESNTDGLEI